ncbi:hypothetical protein ACQUW5_04190 [Legionella sp. CNM-1927-20]|uniref:hypothetical protein n=1 Tax=Legionella sp. CNM-1927-20 TaxID=3422221 RepID=UPI00403AC8DD
MARSVKKCKNNNENILASINALEQVLTKKYNGDTENGTIAQIRKKLSNLDNLKPNYGDYQVSIPRILSLLNSQEEADEFITTYPSYPENDIRRDKGNATEKKQTSRNSVPLQQALMIEELKKRQKSQGANSEGVKAKSASKSKAPSLETSGTTSKAKSTVKSHNNRFLGKPTGTKAGVKDSTNKKGEPKDLPIGRRLLH